MARADLCAAGAALVALLLCAAQARTHDSKDDGEAAAGEGIGASTPTTPAREAPSNGRMSSDGGQSVYGGANSAIPPGAMGEAPSVTAALPWAALLLPLVLGLGVIEATLLHATVLLLAGSYKGRAWLPTAAGVLALAWAAQVALFAGLLAVCLRMRAALLSHGPLNEGGGGGFWAFRVNVDMHMLEPMLYATPIIAFLYWTVLTVASKMRKAAMKRMSIAVISEST